MFPDLLHTFNGRIIHQKLIQKFNSYLNQNTGELTSTSGLLRMSSTLARSPLAAALTSSSLMSPDSCVSNSFFNNWDRRSGQTSGKHQKLITRRCQIRESNEDKELKWYSLRVTSACSHIPPEALLTAEPEGAILVTAAGLYVQDVPQTSTLRSLSE